MAHREPWWQDFARPSPTIAQPFAITTAKTSSVLLGVATLGRICAQSANFGPSVAKFGPCSSTNLAKTWPNLAQVGQGWSSSGRDYPNSLQQIRTEPVLDVVFSIVLRKSSWEGVVAGASFAHQLDTWPHNVVFLAAPGSMTSRTTMAPAERLRALLADHRATVCLRVSRARWASDRRPVRKKRRVRGRLDRGSVLLDGGLGVGGVRGPIDRRAWAPVQACIQR